MENFNAWAQFGELETTEPLIPLQIEQIQQKRHFKIASKWRKSEFYDSLEIENSNGNRVWYQDYSTIDWIHDLLKDKNRARVIQSSSLFVKWFDASQAWILIGAISSGVEVSSNLLTDLKFGYCTSSILSSKKTCPIPDWTNYSDFSQAYSSLISFSIYLLLSSIFSLIASHITLSNIHISTTNKTYPSSNSGIPQLKTILSGFVIRGYLGLKTFFTKTIALVFAVSSGLIIGKQGPLIHISTCIGNILSRFFVKYSNNEGKRREILSAASAAGVAVAFAAPIGGVLFSLEQISYYFPQKVMLRSFFCALISVVVIKFINPLGTGKLVIFQVSYDQDWKFFELIPFLFLGILGGLLGSLFIKISTITTSYQSKLLESRPRLKVVLITIATCILSFTSSLSLLNTSDLLAELFTECNQDSKNMICTTSTTDLVSTLFIKIIFTLLIQDLKIPSGIFIPLMSIGAILGRLTGLLVNEIASKYPLVFPECTSSQCVIPGVYAMVGASSLLTGSTRITISFELTGSLTYTLPIITSIIVSKIIGDYCIESIYDKLLAPFPYFDSRLTNLKNASVSDILEKTLTLEMARRYSIQELEMYSEKLSNDQGFAILQDGNLAGFISKNELTHALNQTRELKQTQFSCFFKRKRRNEIWDPLNSPVIESNEPNDYSKWIDQAPLMVSIHCSIDLVIELFVKMGAKTVLVVDDGRFMGVVYKKRLVTWLKEA